MMFPYIVLLGRTIETYKIMALVGIFSAGIYSCVSSKTKNIDYVETLLFLLAASIGIVPGSHMLYVIVNFRYIGNKQPFLDLFHLFFNGSIFYGGLIGGICIMYIFRRKFTNYRQIIEVVTPSIPLFHFLGRIGCFLTGCCFGIESSIGLEVKSLYIDNSNDIKLLPIQLFEAAFNFMLFILLHKLRDNRLCKDQLLYIYLLLYSVGRFILEFYRGDIYRGIYFHLSTSQLISIIIFGIALFKITNHLHKMRIQQGNASRLQ